MTRIEIIKMLCDAYYEGIKHLSDEELLEECEKCGQDDIELEAEEEDEEEEE